MDALMLQFLRALLRVSVGSAWFGVGAGVFAAAPIDYLRDIKPIFTENCYRCHGASQQKNQLRMDTAALALKGGENGAAFKPGKSADSLLIQVLKGAHPEIARMPFKKSALSEAQVARIEQWINEGAKAPADEAPEMKKHWAFIPPVRATPPAI